MDSTPLNNLTFPYDLDAFTFERILDESTFVLSASGPFFGHPTPPLLFVLDPNFHFVIVLGTFPAPQSARGDVDDVTRLPGILRIERTAFSATFTDHLSGGVITDTKGIGHTDIVRRSSALDHGDYL